LCIWVRTEEGEAFGGFRRAMLAVGTPRPRPMAAAMSRKGMSSLNSKRSPLPDNPAPDGPKTYGRLRRRRAVRVLHHVGEDQPPSGLILDADPAQVPRAAIVLGRFRDDHLERGRIIAIVVPPLVTEGIVQIRPPPRGSHQAGLN